MATDFYTDIKRSEFRFIDEVGAKPFLLYKYYLTYQTAPEIKPSLQTVADDMGMSKAAVCNLNKILVEKKWIRIETGQIIPLKSFRKSERHSEKMNANHSENLNVHSEKMNGSFRKSERPYKEENKHLEITVEAKEKELSETSSDVAKISSPKKSKVQKTPEQELFHKTLWDYQHAFAKISGQGLIVANHKALHSLFKLARGDASLCIAIHEDLQTEVWRRGRVNWVDVEKDFFNYENRQKEKTNGNTQKYQTSGNGKPSNAGERNDKRIDNANAVIDELLRRSQQKSGVPG